MGLILCYKNRGISKDITIQDVNGIAITPGVHDKLRITIGREGQTAELTFTSDSPTADGSSITKGATNRLRLDAADLDFDPGVYCLTIDYYDNADAQEWKIVEKQTFVLESEN